jgi:hypothetical protein
VARAISARGSAGPHIYQEGVTADPARIEPPVDIVDGAEGVVRGGMHLNSGAGRPWRPTPARSVAPAGYRRRQGTPPAPSSRGKRLPWLGTHRTGQAPDARHRWNRSDRVRPHGFAG